MEIWRAVVGYEDYYEVSNLGKVRSKNRTYADKNGVVRSRKGKELSYLDSPWGYYQVRLMVNKKASSPLVHRLVAEAFIPNPENKETVNHINGNKIDNTVDNLEWATNRENQIHANRSGLGGKRTKLTPEQVLQIRQLHTEGITQRAIAAQFNVHPSTIQAVVSGISWKE